MAKKDNPWNMDDNDVWAYPGSDEEKVSAQDGTVIREYHVAHCDRMPLMHEMASFAWYDGKESEEESDEDSCDYEKVGV